jgi:hypothetical protein
MRTHLCDELALLLRIGALTADEARAVNERGHEASFVSRPTVVAENEGSRGRESRYAGTGLLV